MSLVEETGKLLGATATKDSTAGRRVGHLFLNVRHRRLRFLNTVARALHHEGVPFTSADLTNGCLKKEDGSQVLGDELPLMVAWRKKTPVEARYLLSRDGGTEWLIEWTATPVQDPNGQMQGILATVACGPPAPDLREMAELAHDLRTPLQSLRLFCSLLDKVAAKESDVSRAVEGVRDSAERAIQIALELLECCRGPVPHPPPKDAPWFSIAGFLTSLAEEQKVAARAKGLTLVADFASAKGWEIQTDRVRLGRILANLLVNAVRYTSLGGVAFRTSWREHDGSLAISVIDTGPGIFLKEHESSIIQAVDPNRQSVDGDSGGSGLGLAVVDRLVEVLGLKVEINTEAGRGSAFHLLIPRSMLRQTG